MYYIYLIHVHVACIKKNAETHIKTLFKNFYSTTQVAVKIFNTDKKKTSANC